MAFHNLENLVDVEGLKVEVTEFGEKSVGIIKSFDRENRKLALLLDGGHKTLQLFYQNDCEALTIIDDKASATVRRGRLDSLNEVDSDENVADTSKTAEDTPDENNDRHVTVDRAILSEDQMKKVFKEVRPERDRIQEELVLGRRRDRDNPHLRNLVHIQMESLLCGAPPPEDEPDIMIEEKDYSGHVYYILPPVMQTFEPRIDCNNKEVHGGHSEKIIRQKLWKNHKSFPTIETPLKLCVIDKFDDLFSEAVETLEKCARVGLSCEGKMLGRHGQLCWVALSTEDDVFMFDIISLGEDVFKFGLRHILQEGSIRKIVHDARFIADCLHHQYGVEIVNMYDTMVGDQVFLNQQVFEGFLPSNFRSLSTVLRDYLGIEDYHIFYPRYRRTHMEQDTSVWEARPASHCLLLGAARNCLYLQALYGVVRKGTLLPFHQAVSVLQSCIRDQDDPDAQQSLAGLDRLPGKLTAALPDWERDQKKWSSLPLDVPYIHSNASNPDPLCIFSKDSMHQSNQIGNTPQQSTPANK